MIAQHLVMPLWLTASLLQGALAQHDDVDENGEPEADDMGPAAFLWPPDREWLSYHDNVEPCGTSQGPMNRTQFPLANGKVSLVQQEESFNVQLAVSYSNDPQSNYDFAVLIPGDQMKELDPGHQCVSVSNPPSSITEGSNATLQIRYQSVFDHIVNETFYACADITYVAASQFDFNQIQPCFNISEPEPSSTSSDSGATATATASPGTTSGSSEGLSKGAIAGIVIGCLVGLGALGALLFFLYRRDQREKRLLAHQISVRNKLGMNAGPGSRTSAAESGNSVQLDRMSGGK